MGRWQNVNCGSAPSCARSASTPARGAIPARGRTPISISRIIKRFAQTLERGRFDAFFMADHLAVLNMPIDALKRSHTVTSFEPFTLLSALAAVTEHIGLIATASTTFDEPYHVARRFASLDHISGGRAGWNIVTTSNPDAALNFGLDEHMEHDERYRRAREFYDVVTGLWDSLADDAFVRDVESRRSISTPTSCMCSTTRASISRARPAQHRAAGPGLAGDRAGRRVRRRPPARGRDRGGRVRRRRQPRRRPELYADIKGRMDKLGRDRDHLKILPGAFVVVGDTVEEAQEKRARLDSLVHYDSGIASLSVALGHRRLRLRSRRPVAGDPGDQRQQERPRARHRRCRARESHRAPARPARRRLCRARICRHARRPSPTRWRSG